MADAINTTDRETARDEKAPTDRSVRPVIEHALTVYYDGNVDLVRILIDRLIAEARSQ